MILDPFAVAADMVEGIADDIRHAKIGHGCRVVLVDFEADLKTGQTYYVVSHSASSDELMQKLFDFSLTHSIVDFDRLYDSQTRAHIVEYKLKFAHSRDHQTNITPDVIDAMDSVMKEAYR